jgi:hypothetical protein
MAIDGAVSQVGTSVWPPRRARGLARTELGNGGDPATIARLKPALDLGDGVYPGNIGLIGT